jgi:DNA gyrase subunit A
MWQQHSCQQYVPASAPQPDQCDGHPTSHLFPTPQVLQKEVADSYMAYAMSVIMSRALPDVRDGLKPVHRRILYAMHELNLQPSGPHRKCARVVGEVLGKYHPHGDSSVYDALVRMAQDFSLRAPLVDGHGNFGSIDPDRAAAMRYTECKLARLASDALLADVREDIVDFGDNFDGSELEPVVLPAKLPMLLLNGATGIAVGMATNCPPHNLGEVVDALRALIDDRDIPDDRLFELVPAPDFPTGGVIMGTDGARQMYSTGRGSVTIRAKAHCELPRRPGGREAVVVTELPYGVAKNPLLERIALMVNEKKLEGIAHINDESSMEGLRIVFEVKRDAEPLVVLNNMYKRTSLQHTFAGNLMAVVGAGRLPEQLTLRSALLTFIDFRIECLERRTRHRLRKAEERLHLVDGLLIAQERMDDVVASIRAAKGVSEARATLQAPPYALTAEQSEAILSMQLRRLTALEREGLVEEGDTLRATAADLNGLLSERPKLLALIAEELGELKEVHNTPRRSQLGDSADAELSEMDMVANEQCIIIKSLGGYMKRLPLDGFDAQQRGTRGKAGMTNLNDDDAVVQILNCKAHDTVLCLSEKGVAYALPAYKVPETSRTSRGVLVHQLLPIDPNEAISTVLSVSDFTPDTYLVLLTRHGWIKKTPLAAFEKITARGLIAVSLDEGDALKRASLCELDDSVILCSSLGQAVRFETSDQQLRASGRQSRGVKSMAMREGDEIADMFVVPAGGGGEDGGEGQRLVAVTKCGYGKRMLTSHFRCQRRNGKGVIAIKFKRDDDRLVALSPTGGRSREGGWIAESDQELLLSTAKGTIVRQRLSAISEQNRATTGVLLQRLDDDDCVASVALVPAGEGDDCDGGEDEEAALQD